MQATATTAIATDVHKIVRMIHQQQQQQQYFTVLSGVRVAKKYVALVLLVVQTTALVLLMRYTRINAAGANQDQYLVSTAVILAELLKVFLSMASMRANKQNFQAVFVEIYAELGHSDTLKVAVPGLLYLIQNNLLFVALSNLDAAVYQVSYQLKIMTTALFSAIILGKYLDRVKIASLVMLTVGVALVQMAELTSTAPKPQQQQQNTALGLTCVLLASLSSGFAGVYLEKVLKTGRPVSLWMRNIQLGIFGTVFGLFGIYGSKDVDIIRRDGFLKGYTNLVWLVVFMQAFGGLLISYVIQYADNILKGFATSISIVLSALISVWLFHFRLTLYFLVGSTMVICAVAIYMNPSQVVASSNSKV